MINDRHLFIAGMIVGSLLYAPEETSMNNAFLFMFLAALVAAWAGSLLVRRVSMFYRKELERTRPSPFPKFVSIENKTGTKD